MTEAERLTVSSLVEFYLERSRPIGVVVSDDIVLAQAIKATQYYEGYGTLARYDPEQLRDLVIDERTGLTKGEMAVIFPLFELYVERENALILESSRALGVEVYGRTVSEIAQEITQKEQEIQNLAFQFDWFTI